MQRAPVNQLKVVKWSKKYNVSDILILPCIFILSPSARPLSDRNTTDAKIRHFSQDLPRTLNKRTWAKVQAFHMRFQRRILSVKWNDFIPNVTVAKNTMVWLGQYHQHSSCTPITNVRPRRQIQSCCSSIQHHLHLLRFRRWMSPDHSWRRSSGRPRTTWLDRIFPTPACLCDSSTDTFYLTQDRSQWRAVAMAAKAICSTVFYF